MIKKSGITKKMLIDAALGISVEILYVLAIMALAFLICLIIIR